MDRGLVAIGGTETSATLLREAAEQAIGSDAELVLYSAFTSQSIEHDLVVLDRIRQGEYALTGEQGGSELARKVGEQIARRVLEPYDVQYRVIGAVVEKNIGNRLVSAAEKHDCDHVFLTSKRRSIIGGALGKRALSVLKQFDGITTIAREGDSPKRLGDLRISSTREYEFDLFDGSF